MLHKSKKQHAETAEDIERAKKTGEDRGDEDFSQIQMLLAVLL